MSENVLGLPPRPHPVGEGYVDMSPKVRYNLGRKAWENERRGLRLSDKEEMELWKRRQEIREEARKQEREEGKRVL